MRICCNVQGVVKLFENIASGFRKKKKTGFFITIHLKKFIFDYRNMPSSPQSRETIPLGKELSIC
jgi:hypothetical protein